MDHSFFLNKGRIYYSYLKIDNFFKVYPNRLLTQNFILSFLIINISIKPIQNLFKVRSITFIN